MRPVGPLERRAQRLQLHDLRIAELARDQRCAIAVEQEHGRDRG